MHCSKELFDDFVGGGEQRRRHGQAERLGRLDVDNQLELGGLLHRQVGGFLAFKNATGVAAEQTGGYTKCATVAHEAPGRSEGSGLVDSGYRVADGQSSKILDSVAE